ncbi:hypothetical protein BD770DRAFT_419764 [Pilaira anomala]|nr:hypothetical protein BD770DRAFT_419764 [Pilaira anomala]
MFSLPPPPPPPLMSGVVPLFDRDISPPRKRTRTSPEQLTILEKSFSTNPSPNNRVREQLSLQLGMPERSIQIWFQNRRAKVKNQAKRNIQLKDSTLYHQQQYAATAAAAACQSAAFQQQKDSIDPNLYYYYYYYYFHQQQQQQQQQQQPVPSTSYSTPSTTHSWSMPDLTLSASTSSSSNTSRRQYPSTSSHQQHRSTSSSSSSSHSHASEQRTRAHSVGPYPYYRKSTPQERHASLGPSPQTPQFMYSTNESRLYQSTIMEEPYSTISSHVKQPQAQQKFNLSAQTLQIGSWKRVCDLNCQIDLSRRTIQWCIGDEEQKFRMDINLNLVQYIKTTANRLEFFLSSPLEIKFYMTTTTTEQHDQKKKKSWIQCHDFTQDKQASLENIHVLESFDHVLHTQFMELLMLAPELQSLIIQEDEPHTNTNTMDSNLLLLQGLHLPQH